jgi:hypothetical protein
MKVVVEVESGEVKTRRASLHVLEVKTAAAYVTATGPASHVSAPVRELRPEKKGAAHARTKSVFRS